MRRLLRVVGRWVTIPRWTVLAGIAGVLVLLAVLVLVIVYLPQLAIDPRGLTPDQVLTHIQDLRTSILQGLGGLAVLVGAVVAALNLRETSRQNRAVQGQSRAMLEETSRQNRAMLELQRRGQTTERFTRAIE